MKTLAAVALVVIASALSFTVGVFVGWLTADDE